MEIQIRKLKELDHKTYRRLYRLNNAYMGGIMRPVLVAFRNDNQRYWKDEYGSKLRTSLNPEAFVVYATNSNRTIVSWSLLYNNYGNGHTCNWGAMIFTSAKHRRRGYGQAVLGAVFEFAKKEFGIPVDCFPHNNVSREFFDKVIPITHKGAKTFFRYADHDG